MSEDLAYVVTSDKGFDEAVAAVEAKTKEKGFRLIATHDTQGMLAEKGIQREPYRIIEL